MGFFPPLVYRYEMAFDDTCELLFGESEMGLGRYHNDSSYNSSLNLTYVRRKSEAPTSKLRTLELHLLRSVLKMKPLDLGFL